MQAILQFILLWLVVPGILLLLIYVSVNLALMRSQPHDPTDDAVRAVALLLGCALLILLIVLNQFSNFMSSQSMGTFAQTSNQALLLIVGCLSGALLLTMVELLSRQRALSVLIVVLFTMSSYAMYLYLFISASRGILLDLSVSFLIGELIYAMIRPKLFQRLRVAELMRRTFRWVRRR